MASVWKVLEIICYLMLLFFMVPIKIENDPKLQNFLNYARDFNKSYVDKEMFNVRFDTFKKSLEQIEMFNDNKTKSSARYGLTSFTDFFPYSVILPIKTNLTKLFELQEHWGPIPNKVDWRRKNAITNVKNQKDCGSCWAFSVIETIESMAAIKTKKLREFSVQQSVDCSVENWGCQGGDMCSLAHWIVMNNVSVMLEQDYPYTGSNQSCQMKKTFTGVYISKYSCGSLIGAEDAILSYLAFKGPLAVALNVNSWQNYVGGVIQFHCDSNYTNLNHSAQIVGYDLSGDIPYYIVRNSWGKQYGDKGYVYIAVGSNMCGIVNKVLSLDVL